MVDLIFSQKENCIYHYLNVLTLKLNIVFLLIVSVGVYLSFCEVEILIPKGMRI